MRKKSPIQEILPWTNSELEALLRGLIAHGTEAAKIDFKAEVETGTPEQKAELLKDILAIANTYDENYGDYGFLIYGIKTKTISGVTATETNTDKLQNTIEQILKTYVSPMPQIYVVGFQNTTGEKWGAIVIPPRNTKPHMFFKDLSCTNPTRSRRRGEWFVRHGSTTDPGLPEDLTIINQKQTELLLEPIRESIRSLQSRVGKTEEQYNSALFKLIERAVSNLPAAVKSEEEEVKSDIGEALGLDLPTRLKQKLRTPTDALAEDLLTEAKIIRDYVDGLDTGLPWAPQMTDAEANKKIIEEIEEKTRALQLSVATIVLNDRKNIYTEALLRAVRLITHTIEAPTGTPYNRIGQSLRYYPLGIILYTVFICGVASGRGDILKKILEIPLKHRTRDATSHITEILYYWYDAKGFFNQAFAQRWCEPISHRIRQIINDRIGEMIADFSEPEYFFRGEFVLALIHIDLCITSGEAEEHSVPYPGLYLYFHEAHSPIKQLILENPDWLNKLYSNSLANIFNLFDQNANKAVSSNCFGMSLHGLNAKETYDKFSKKKEA
ncbi:MAG: ATP-binding protein [Syntrophaceae bacterium]|nr:ATP-binding protein [Syntrophaceae bacterium]